MRWECSGGLGRSDRGTQGRRVGAIEGRHVGGHLGAGGNSNMQRGQFVGIEEPQAEGNEGKKNGDYCYVSDVRRMAAIIRVPAQMPPAGCEKSRDMWMWLDSDSWALWWWCVVCGSGGAEVAGGCWRMELESADRQTCRLPQHLHSCPGQARTGTVTLFGHGPSLASVCFLVGSPPASALLRCMLPLGEGGGGLAS